MGSDQEDCTQAQVDKGKKKIVMAKTKKGKKKGVTLTRVIESYGFGQTIDGEQFQQRVTTLERGIWIETNSELNEITKWIK